MHSQDKEKPDMRGTRDLPAEERAGEPDTAGDTVPQGMTLEGIVTMTGEMEHLNELVLLHVEKAGGFSCTASYLAIVNPVLDLLEREIRFRYRDGMGRDEIRDIIAVWIDSEIAAMQPHAKRAGKKGSE
jgi:hypothetical protein